MKKHFGDITEELKNKTSSEKIYLTLGLNVRKAIKNL